MTAPRAREQADPPSPPDRLPSPRGGHPSPSTASAAGRPAGARRGLVGSARALAAAALLALFGGLALLATAQAQTTGICDRTQQVQDEILRQLSAVSDCAAVTELSLEDKSITSLKAGDFDGLTAVWKINLNFNQLGALPANLFSGLTSLTWLEVQERRVDLATRGRVLRADGADEPFPGRQPFARLAFRRTCSPGSRV